MAERNSNPRSRSWFIVSPNIRKNGVLNLGADYFKDMNEEEICNVVVERWCEDSTAKAAACLYCKSEKGMEHLHIVLCNKNAICFNSIKKFIGRQAHIEETRGRKEDVEAYINKSGKFAEKGEVILAKAQVGELIGKQGKRSDLEYIRQCIDEGMSWQEVRRQDSKYFDNRFTSIIKNMYFDKRKLETPFKREVMVHWCMGDSGSGKTGITLDLVEKEGEDNLYLVSDYQHGFDNYSGEPYLILDEFRGQLPFATLLSALEGYKKEMAARYANVLSLWNEVFITTVKSPEETYAKMLESADNENDPIAQLLCRITDVSYCYRVNRKDGKKRDRDGEPCEFYRFTISGKDYRALTDNRAKQLKALAFADYLRRNYKEGDTCEAFDIEPSKEGTAA